MDKLDYKILNILKENGRETASDISKAIHLSVSAVLDRIKKMEESGIIKGYTVRAVSYTHLDVYKRQVPTCLSWATAPATSCCLRCGDLPPASITVCMSVIFFT